MRRTEFDGMCELAGEGRLTWLENIRSHEKGRVISCESDKIEVDVAGQREEWQPSECQELTYGYKVDYDEVIKHPHEFDSHLD